MLRLPLSVMSPSGPRGRLNILIFHRVLAEPDPISPDTPDATAFESQMRWVRDWFNVLPLEQAARAHEMSESHHTRGKILLKVAD